MYSKILVALGTRPEAIKLAPLILELRSRSNVEVIVCATGQHIQMLNQALAMFDVPADIDLSVMKPGQDLFDVTSSVLLGMRDVLRKHKPDLVIVQGDTTTTFSSALSAFYERIPIAHVEAGLRTFDRYAPYPEEINRVMTTSLAELHFAPTIQSKANLLLEHVPESKIHITGNTAIDALFHILRRIETTPEIVQLPDHIHSVVQQSKKRILVTGHRRENFGDGFENICRALALIAERDDVEIIYPVHLNPNVQEPVKRILGDKKNIHLLEPLDYASFAYLMSNATIIITDSGGVQEEAPSLGKPVLVMRDVTERPEAVNAGTVKLVGTDFQKISSEAIRLLDDERAYTTMSFAHNPYGDGTASKQIADILLTVNTK
jgi:UDP-N-acetylglucosamine 2-epimerase (non-hydrolysing)